jgi:hypothetical protein
MAQVAVPIDSGLQCVRRLPATHALMMTTNDGATMAV